MQRWEYLTITVGDGRPIRAYLMNGQELRDWKRGPHYSAFINDLGAQGWELVATLAICFLGRMSNVHACSLEALSPMRASALASSLEIGRESVVRCRGLSD